MVDARREAHHPPDTANKQPLIPPAAPSAAKPTSQLDHTVVRAADVPKVSESTTMAWVIGVCSFVMLGAVLLWLLPMIGSDRQEEQRMHEAPSTDTR